MFGIRYDGEASKNLQNALDIEYGTNSTYLHAHLPKINSSSVKNCDSSRPRLARVSPASHPRLAQKFSIVTRAVVKWIQKCRFPFEKQLTPLGDWREGLVERGRCWDMEADAGSGRGVYHIIVFSVGHYQLVD